jgi:hypothetical protein
MLPKNDKGIHRTTESAFVWHGPHRSLTSSTILLSLLLLVSGRTLPSRCIVMKDTFNRVRCLATVRGTHTHTGERDLWSTPLRKAQVAWYTVPSFIRIGSASHRLKGDTDRQHADLVNLLLSAKNEGSRVKAAFWVMYYDWRSVGQSVLV